MQVRRVRWLILLLPVAILVLLAASAPGHVRAAPTEQIGPVFIVIDGTVVAATRLNVRDRPGLNGQIVGKLPRGARVQIVGRSGAWLLIRFPPMPVGYAWVSAAYVAINGQGPPVSAPPVVPAPRPPVASAPGRAVAPPPVPPAATVPDIRVGAPDLVDYQPTRFRWRWSQDPVALAGLDWYTDILLFFKNEVVPYQTLVAEPHAVTRSEGLFVFDAPITIRCDTFAVARIAVRQNGQFVGWVSDRGTPIDLGPSCAELAGSDKPSSGGGGGGNDPGSGGPTPTPIVCDQFDNFPDCPVP